MILAFEDIELDLGSYEVRRAGERVPVQPQVFDVLWHLASSGGQLVTKNDLLDEVWGDRFVSESALSSRIKSARQAVGDDGSSQRVISTVHGRGYKFLPAVTTHRRSRVTATHVTPRDDTGATLIERDDVLDALGQAVASARAGNGRLVCLSGEAGIGKSSVVREFERRFGSITNIATAACDDLTTPRALGPFHDVIAQLPDDRRPSLADPRDAATCLLSALEDIGAERGCAVVIEDLHWADDATLDAVRQLARRVRDAPVMLLITFRDEDVALTHPLRKLLGSVRGPHVSSIRLEPLSATSVARLAEAAGRDGSEVFRVTGGNPLFVVEVIESPPDVTPDSVVDAVVARLALLPDDDRDVVQAISVVPARAERTLIEALGWHLDTNLAAAERLGLLAGDAGHVWFRHELVRRAVEATIVPSTAVRLHGEIARSLAERPGSDPARIVHHAVRGGATDLVLRAGQAAASAAERAGAQRQAAEHLDTLLRHADQLSPAVRADLLTRRTHALYLLNRFTASMECAEAAVAASEESGDSSQLARALIAYGRTAMWATGPMSAGCAVTRALEVLGPEGDPALRATAHADLARALGELATVGSVAQGSTEARDHAETALELAERLGRSDLRGYALMYLGSERLASGDAAGLPALDEAISLLGHHPRTDFAVRACVNAAGGCLRAGRFDEVERYVEQGLTWARGAEFFSGEYRLALTRASARMASGRWSEAEAELTALLELDGEPGIMEPLARSLLARLLARRGESARARAALEPALEAIATSDEPRVIGPIRVAEVELCWLEASPVDSDEMIGSVLGSRGTAATSGELLRYLRWAGEPISGAAAEPSSAPEPWASGLRGDWQRAAAEWERRGEPYEQALELLSGPSPDAHRAGRDLLASLGATATIAALGRDRLGP